MGAVGTSRGCHVLYFTMAFLCAFAPCTGQAQTTAAGFTPGSFQVNPSEAAAYTIPIQVPPGIAGMEPKLALSYNSQAGNGRLGMGWSLSGLSAIARCPRTVVQDGVKGGINYDWNDRYCLDGQRLVMISGTSYGANNAEYRTEQESFTKVISFNDGTAGNGATSFKVWTKAGQIMEYGGTADSRIEAQGISTVRVWALNKISDTKGNYLTVTYTEDNPNGDYYPIRIDYTGNASSSPPLTPGNSVRFEYETRTDQIPLYQAGSIINATMRMIRARTYSGATLVNELRLAYDYGGPAGRSRMTSVTQCDATAACLPSTTFAWNPQPNQYGAAAQWASTTFNPSAGWFTTGIRSRIWRVDVNGDGLVDILALDGNQITVQLNTGTAFQPPAFWGNTDLNTNTGWFTNSLQQRVWAVDVNGDGLVDLLALDSTAIYVQLNTGSGFQPVASWGSTGFNTNAGWFTTALQPRVWPVDVNGDGLVDLLGVDADGIYVQLNSGVGFQSFVSWGSNAFNTNSGWFTTSLVPRVWPVDVDGDGLVDLVGMDSNQIVVQLNKGTGFQPGLSWGTTVFNSNLGWFATIAQPHVWPLNVKGDGMTAFVGIDDNYLAVQLLAGPSGLAPWSRIVSITDGLGSLTNLDYKPLPQGVYTKDSGASAATYPNVDIQDSMYVVSSANRSNGIGGAVVSNFSYGGAKSNYLGRGFLGFRWYESTDQATGLKVRTEFRQDWPYTGVLSLITKTQPSSAILNQVTNTYSCTNPTTGAACAVAAGNRYFPFVSQSVETSNDLNGALLPTVTTTTVYDAYGNPISIVASTGDGYSKTTANIYASPDTANWFVGRLTRSTVTSVTP